MPQAIAFLENQDTAWSNTEDRRAYLRHPATLRARCTLVTNGADPPTWTARIRDLSSFGVGLILPRAPGLGQLLAIELTRKNGALVRTALARVVHNSRESSKSFFVGCAFIRELKDDHLRLFHPGAVHVSGPDCRRWTRFPCNVETAIHPCNAASCARHSGRIFNISAGGIGLVLSSPFSEATLLRFELPQERNLANPNNLVRVVRAMQQDGGNWCLGCEFADQLSVEQLRALLR